MATSVGKKVERESRLEVYSVMVPPDEFGGAKSEPIGDRQSEETYRDLECNLAQVEREWRPQAAISEPAADVTEADRPTG